jgi:radical SAM superfamily enzyme YgiQ (UPF0313 family)
MSDIVIINPRFNVSFWGMEKCMGLLGKRANLPVACLPLLAALVPDHHRVTIIDENVEVIDFDRVSRADLVCVTGMSVQGRRIREVLQAARARGCFTVVGGPMATVEPEQLKDLADVVFIGEADTTWPLFLAEWEQGRHRRRYTQPEKTDLSTLPLPKVGLLKTSRYMFGSMQISRGCPFTCEFCDIIVTFGRKPRLKASRQVLSELDSYLAAGLRIVFVVDDNLIGNKKAIKPILRDIIGWQEEHGYPLTLFTEASLDLAEDGELMDLMGRAGFQSVFIGIESPNEESLKETKKLQNVRPRAGTLIERVHRIQDHGLDVWCGMIVGFDNDDATVFEALPRFLAQSHIGNALVGLLHAIPTTPLHARLKAEGRLNNDADSEIYGTNVVPLGLKRGDLRDGFLRVMQELYTPQSYFERIDSLFFARRFRFAVHQLAYWRAHRWLWLKRSIGNYVKFGALALRLLRHVESAELRSAYRHQLRRVLRQRYTEPHILFIYSIKIAMHYHYDSLVGKSGGTMPEGLRSFSRGTNGPEAVAQQPAA